MRRQLDWAIPVLVLAALAAYFLGESVLTRFHLPLDDAWIHRVYARAFASGQGLAYNPGQQEAGETSPLWAILTAPAHWFEGYGIDAVVLIVKLMGLACAAGSVVLVARLTRQLSGSAWAAVLAASLFASEPRLLFAALSGMENSLLVLLWLGALYAYISGPLWLSGVLVSLTPTCRPEAAFLLPLWLIAVFLLPADRRPSRRARGWLALVVVPTSVWLLFCRTASGHWLPNTYYVKVKKLLWGSNVWSDPFAIITLHGYGATIALYVGLSAFVVACVMMRRRRAALSVATGIVVAPVLFAVGIALTRRVPPLGFYWTRWFDAASLLLTAALCVGLALLLQRGFDQLRRRAWYGARDQLTLALSAACLVSLLVALPSVARDVAQRRAQLASDAYVIKHNHEDVGRWLNEHMPPHATLALEDAGAIRYFAERPAIDLIGLNNHRKLFKLLSDDEIAQSATWIAVFPHTMERFSQRARYRAVTSFRVLEAQYTICPCPSQIETVIYQRTDQQQQNP